MMNCTLTRLTVIYLMTVHTIAMVAHLKWASVMMLGSQQYVMAAYSALYAILYCVFLVFIGAWGKDLDLEDKVNSLPPTTKVLFLFTTMSLNVVPPYLGFCLIDLTKIARKMPAFPHLQWWNIMVTIIALTSLLILLLIEFNAPPFNKSKMYLPIKLLNMLSKIIFFMFSVISLLIFII